MSQKIYHRIREVRKREISQVNIDRDKSLFSLVSCPTKKGKGGGTARGTQRDRDFLHAMFAFMGKDFQD